MRTKQRMAMKPPKVMSERMFIKLHDNAVGFWPPKMQHQIKRPHEEITKNWNRLTKGYQYPTVAGYNDPLACMLVAREVLRVEPGNQIRAFALAGLLSVNAPHYVWTSQTVGRILGSIAELAEATARSVDRNELPYLESMRDGKGNFYVMWDAPQAYYFMFAVLDALAVEVEKAEQRVRKGGQINPRDSVWVEIEPDWTYLDG